MHALRVGGKREGSAGYEDVSREKAAMASSDKPRLGTKRRIMYNLLHRPQGATLAELNRATGWDAFSCINDTKAIARDYGGTPHITAVGNRAGSG
ncbi:DUF3489 domain-containing protein [Mesorhizobium sp. M6A.T.Ce.TU.002.03.1.1]|nr:DUF3489 domain-containing protein [Mesorhizobium sp. M6A.T.Ce.TU.002.03.1.1]